MQDETAKPTSYLLVDGENIDATLGTDVLHRRPTSEERPRWDRVLDFVQTRWPGPVRGLFFLNASSGTVPGAFVQALLALRYRVIPLAGAPNEKVVDMGIQRTLQALRERQADVVLASHDADFAADLEALLDGRNVAVIGFREFVSQRLVELEQRGLQFFDIESAVGAFNVRLPRTRIIPIAEFRPEEFLD